MQRSCNASSAASQASKPTLARQVVTLLLWGQFVALLTILILVQADVVDSSWIPTWLGPGDAGHLDRLALAVERKDLADLEHQLDRHRDRIDTIDIDGMNPLLRAAADGWVIGCRTLLERGAKVAVADSRGTTPLCYAIMVQGIDGRQIVELLLDQGADVDGKDCGSQVPLGQAAFAARPDMAQILLRHGASVARRGVNDWTPLHWAAAHPDGVELVSMLLQAGADPRAVDNEGISPTDVARQFGHDDAIKLMQAIERSANESVPSGAAAAIASPSKRSSQ
jgi:ankyrin repeat protein